MTHRRAMVRPCYNRPIYLDYEPALHGGQYNVHGFWRSVRWLHRAEVVMPAFAAARRLSHVG